MITTVSDIIKIMEKIAPPFLAESWDNSGLQIGKTDWRVKTVRIALDPSLLVVKEAVQDGVDMLISHHPLFFRGLKTIDFATAIGEIINLSVRNSMTIYAAHTNMDSVDGGLNDVLADKLCVKNTKVLMASSNSHQSNFNAQKNGLGRIGELENSLVFEFFAKKVKEKFKNAHIQMVGKSDLIVKKVALCSGSGASLLNDFFKSEAQVYVTGDMKYHDAKAIEERGLGLLDIGHFYSEHLIVEHLSNRLTQETDKAGFNVNIEKCNSEKDPYSYL